MNYITNTVELRKAMAEKGYNTISSLSHDCNVNRVTLGKILKGTIQPTADIMYKIADCLLINSEQAGKIFFSPNLRNK